MEILTHFEITDGDVVKIILKDGERDDFLAKLPEFYRLAYVTPADLAERIRLLSSSKLEELSELIPDRGNIRSGDFGEILSYLIFEERHRDKLIEGPLKWRWKQDKNTPAPYTDVILYSVQDINSPSIDDTLISVESKMKATASTENQIQNAIEGAEKDFVSRIASSLAWLRSKYKAEVLKTGIDVDLIRNAIGKIERFINSDSKGPYTKKVKAIAFLDKAWFDEDLEKPLTRRNIDGLSLTVFAVSIEDLRTLYEQVLDSAVTYDD